MVQLLGAYAWECETCGAKNCEEAEEWWTLVNDAGDPVYGDLPDNLDTHFETLDEEGGMSRYMVVRVLVGPPFVKCATCQHVFPAVLPEMLPDEDDEDDEDITAKD